MLRKVPIVAWNWEKLKLPTVNESMVFNVMHNQTGNGLIIQNNSMNNEERELYKQQIETLKEEVGYLKKIIDNLLK